MHGTIPVRMRGGWGRNSVREKEERVHSEQCSVYHEKVRRSGWWVSSKAFVLVSPLEGGGDVNC